MMARGITALLPTGWSGFNEQQKIGWFNQNAVTPEELAAAGVSQDVITTMQGRGYTGIAANANTATTNPRAVKSGLTTAQQKAGEYKRLRDLGMSDADVRSAVTPVYGTQTDTDWTALQGLAGFGSNANTATTNTSNTTASNPRAVTAGLTTAQQKAGEYKRLRDLGMTDAEVRSAVTPVYGSQTDADWNSLQGLAGFGTNTNTNTNTNTTTVDPKAVKTGLTTAQQKADEYKRLRGLGMTDAEIRSAVTPIYGTQADADWTALQGLAGFGPTGNTTAITANTTAIDPSQSTLSPNFSPYVYKMLAKGEAAADLPYQPFTGERFAGPSALQQRAFEIANNLETPEAFGTASGFAQQAFDKAAGTSYTPTTFDTGLGSLKSVAEYMSPYQQNVTDITSREMRRQADIGRQSEQARLAQAGAYGGSRQAIMESERQRNLQQQMEDITTKGLQGAYDRAMQQRLSESQLGLEAQRGTEGSRQFGANLGLQSVNPMISAASTLGNLGQQQANTGLSNLNAQLSAGATQQGFMQQPLDFGYQQFQESVKFPYQQATYMQSLLGGLPLQAAPYSSSQGQSGMFSGLQGALAGLALYNAFNPTATPK